MNNWIILTCYLYYVCGAAGTLFLARKGEVCGSQFLNIVAALLWPIVLPLLGLTVLIIWACDTMRARKVRKEC